MTISEIQWSRSGQCLDPLETRRVVPQERNLCGVFALPFGEALECNVQYLLLHFDINERTGNNWNANDPAADSQAAAAKSEKIQVDALAGMPAKARRLYPSLHNDTKETELSDA